MTDHDPARWRHGTTNGYRKYGCRCVDCRAANTADAKLARERRRTAETPEQAHGTPGGYSNHACRCQPCKDAHAAAVRAFRARRRAE